MTNSSDFGRMARLKYWVEDHGFGFAMAGAILFIGGLMAFSIGTSLQEETYDARVTALDSSPAHTETGTSCNGDPVLLICSDTMVEVPAYYSVTLTYDSPVADEYSNRGDECRQDLTAEEFAALEIGDPVLVEYRSWDGCSVKDWDALVSR